jgi:hypothetical protein
VPLFNWVGAFQIGWQLGSMLKDELDRFDEDIEGEHFGVHVSKDEIELAGLLAQRAERERSEEAKLARSRWLEEHRAERSFPCGIVPDPQPAAPSDGSGDAPGEAPAFPPAPAPPPDDESQPGWAAPLPSQPGWGMPEPDVLTPPVPPEPPSELPGADLKPMQVLAAVLPADVVFIREYGDDEEVEEVGRLPRRAIQEVDVVDCAGVHVPEPVEENLEEPRLAWTVLRWTNQGAPDEDRFAFRSSWMAGKAARYLLAAKQG